MKISWEGKDWPVSFDDLSMKQAETVEAEAGMAIGAWLDILNESFDTKSPQFIRFVKIIYWLMLNQNGDKTPIGAVDFPLLKFAQAFTGAAAAEDAAAPPAEEEIPIPPVMASETRYPGPPIQPAGMSLAGTPATGPSVPA